VYVIVLEFHNLWYSWHALLTGVTHTRISAPGR